MPIKSEQQRKFMAMCLHNPDKAQGKCPPKSVAKKFIDGHKRKDEMTSHYYYFNFLTKLTEEGVVPYTYKAPRGIVPRRTQGGRDENLRPSPTPTGRLEPTTPQPEEKTVRPVVAKDGRVLAPMRNEQGHYPNHPSFSYRDILSHVAQNPHEDLNDVFNKRVPDHNTQMMFAHKRISIPVTSRRGDHRGAFVDDAVLNTAHPVTKMLVHHASLIRKAVRSGDHETAEDLINKGTKLCTLYHGNHLDIAESINMNNDIDPRLALKSLFEAALQNKLETLDEARVDELMRTIGGFFGAMQARGARRAALNQARKSIISGKDAPAAQQDFQKAANMPRPSLLGGFRQDMKSLKRFGQGVTGYLGRRKLANQAYRQAKKGGGKYNPDGSWSAAGTETAAKAGQILRPSEKLAAAKTRRPFMDKEFTDPATGKIGYRLGRPSGFAASLGSTISLGQPSNQPIRIKPADDEENEKTPYGSSEAESKSKIGFKDNTDHARLGLRALFEAVLKENDEPYVPMSQRKNDAQSLGLPPGKETPKEVKKWAGRKEAKRIAMAREGKPPAK